MNIFYLFYGYFNSLRRLLDKDALSVLSLTGEPSKLEENLDTIPTRYLVFFEEMKTY